MSIRTTQEGRGNTVPGDLQNLPPAKPREVEAWRKELADKVAARHSGEGGSYGITRDADGKLRTTTRPA